MINLIKIKPVVMTIIHIAGEEEAGLCTKTVQRKKSFGPHAVHNGHTCDSR